MSDIDFAPSETYSLKQEFEAWKAEGSHDESWSDKRNRDWNETIDAYLTAGWVLIPCQHRQKWPDKGADWKADETGICKCGTPFDASPMVYKCPKCGTAIPGRFSPELLKWHVTHGGNVAINAGESGIAICDYDSKYLPPKLIAKIGKMPIIVTPNGYAFLARPPVIEETTKRLWAAFPAFDTPRAEGMYEVVPLSETCKLDKKGAHKAKPMVTCPHDWRVRRWIGGTKSIGLPMPTFEEFVASLV
jgi:hypothetical protein